MCDIHHAPEQTSKQTHFAENKKSKKIVIWRISIANRRYTVRSTNSNIFFVLRLKTKLVPTCAHTKRSNNFNIPEII